MESNNLLIPLSISCFSAVQLIFSLSTLLTFTMTLQSHPNSSWQRQWLWRWELTVARFCPFSLQTVLSRFSSTEGCPTDASGQAAVQSRHVSSSIGDLEAGQYYEWFLFCLPSLAYPKTVICPPPLPPPVSALTVSHAFGYSSLLFPSVVLPQAAAECAGGALLLRVSGIAFLWCQSLLITVW